MSKNKKPIKVVSIVLLIQTIIWLIFTIISMSDVKPNWTTLDYVKWVSEPNIFFVGNYVNATILTFVATLLFSLLFNFFYQDYKNFAITAFVFVPIYGLINIICYSMQISIVPLISQNALDNSETLFLSSQLIQANNQTLIGYINGLAYAILGIPSIIFGFLLFKVKKKLSGISLFLSGIMSIIGIIGYILNNQLLSTGTMIGGVVFLVFLVFSSMEFKLKE